MLIFILIFIIIIIYATYTGSAENIIKIIEKIREDGYCIDTIDNKLNYEIGTTFKSENNTYIKFTEINHLTINKKSYNFLSSTKCKSHTEKKYKNWFFYTQQEPIILGPYKWINIMPYGHYGAVSSYLWYQHTTGKAPLYAGDSFFTGNIYKHMRFYIKIISGTGAAYHGFIISENKLYSSWNNQMQFREIKDFKTEYAVAEFINNISAIKKNHMKELTNIFGVKYKKSYQKIDEQSKNILINYTYSGADYLILTDGPNTLFWTDIPAVRPLILARAGVIIDTPSEYPVVISENIPKFPYSYIIKMKGTKFDKYIYPVPTTYKGRINFDKLAEYVPEEFNSPVKIIKAGKYMVFRDDYLAGGTKQRGLYNFVKESQANVLIYVGPPQGAAQIALGVLATHFNRVGVMFYVAPQPTLHPMSKKAQHYGTILKYAGPTDEEAKIIATEYAEKHNGLILPFGLLDDRFTYFFVSALKQAIPEDLQMRPIRIWVVIGSGTLVNALYYVFPNAYFMIVQVGLKRYWKSIDYSRSRLFISGYRFSESPTDIPPYPSVSSYDAKIWEIIERYGAEGDYIWNVASEKI